jgi:phosphoenolpyruvate carboxykinase (GTP)
MPRHEDIEWTGLDFPLESFLELTAIDRGDGLAEAEEQKDHLAQFDEQLPPALEEQRQRLVQRLHHAPDLWRAGA